MKIPDNISDRIRRQANTINSLVVSGMLDPKDIDKLMIHGVDLGSILVYNKYFRKGGQNGRHKHRGQ